MRGCLCEQSSTLSCLLGVLNAVLSGEPDPDTAGGLRQEITEEVMSAARQLQEQHAEDVPGLTAPAAVVPCSAITGRVGWAAVLVRHVSCLLPGWLSQTV